MTRRQIVGYTCARCGHYEEIPATTPKAHWGLIKARDGYVFSIGSHSEFGEDLCSACLDDFKEWWWAKGAKPSRPPPDPGRLSP